MGRETGPIKCSPHKPRLAENGAMTNELMRAYEVQYRGSFDPLQAYVDRAHGHAYSYTPKANRRRREEYQSAVVVLPKNESLRCGAVLCNEEGFCEIVSSRWVAPP